MRRLISQCRKSPFIERSFRRDNLPHTIAILTMLVVASCQLGRNADEHEVVAVDTKATTVTDATSAEAPPATTVSARSIQLISGASKFPVATLLEPACTGSANDINITTQLHSRFGDYPVLLTLTPIKGAQEAVTLEAVRAAVDGYTASFATPPVLAGMLKTLACAEDSVSEITLDQASMAHLTDMLERLAPDCERLDPSAAGFNCRLPKVDPEAARLELVGIQTTMIRRWSRQPYLLARRLAVGVTLAQALQATDVDRALDGFCKLIQSAIPAELPAAIAGRRWQGAACGSDHAQRLDAALFGLAKTIGEVDTMRQLFERTSRLGHLAVRIPNKTFRGNLVLVSLSPEADVAENLAKETQKLWTSPSSDAAPIDTPRACWHPLFAETPELLQLARQLDLVGDADQLTCAAPMVETAGGFAPERYFAESITSETEFVVSNGRAKTLRLPLGHYRYTLRELPENPDTWDDASQVTPQANGTITWDAKRPHAVIATW